jgi:hypothetical protein
VSAVCSGWAMDEATTTYVYGVSIAFIIEGEEEEKKKKESKSQTII